MNRPADRPSPDALATSAAHSTAAARSIEEYLRQLRAALGDADPALVQDALYDAEEYLRAEIAAHPDKSEADVLELIASTYGAPEEVAAAYVENDAKVSAALAPPAPRTAPQRAWLARVFSVYVDPRAWSSLFFMVLCLATGIFYFTFAVTGLSLSAGLAVLVIGVPFFLAFIGLSRVLALGEGRLLEAVTGERMPRRPKHPGATLGFWARVVAMLKDTRTWTTLAYFIAMLPLGILYFTIAVVGGTLGIALTLAPFWEALRALGAVPQDWRSLDIDVNNGAFVVSDSPVAMLALGLLGVLILTSVLHAARGIGRGHARLAKSLLVDRL
jgi:uncharacterized membrane protein